MKKRNINPVDEAWLEEYSRYLGEVGEGYTELTQDVAYDIEKFNDPLFIGALIYRLVQEREKTNKMFEQILSELKEIHTLLKEREGGNVPTTSKTALGDVDEKIVELVKERGKATAKEIADALGYRGRNAASARLNRLYTLGILKKTRAGRKVYYSLGGR